MKVTVVYESMFGDTHQVAESIAAGIREAAPQADVTVAPVGKASAEQAGAADLLVVGGPTHMLGMSNPWSRGKAEAIPGAELDDDASVSEGVREWLAALPHTEGRAASFDTHLPNPLAGGAARPIARRLRRVGRTVLAHEGFVVDDAQGPLRAGELDRARSWGAELARRAGTAEG
jgi:hypothetical protein